MQSSMVDTIVLVCESLGDGLTTGKDFSDFSNDPRRFVLSYQASFNQIWDFDGPLVSWLTRNPRTLILLWDGVPDEASGLPVDISAHVTAFDWIAALTLAISKRCPTFCSRIVLADLASQRYPGAEGVRLLRKLQDSSSPLFPWLTILDFKDLDRVRDEARQIPENTQIRETASLLRYMWLPQVATQTKSSNPHVIANLVGPRVLLNAMGRKDHSPNNLLVSALDSLLVQLELIVSSSSLPAPWIRSSEWKKHNDVFVLVDDMASVGWSEFVAAAFDLAPNELLTCSDISGQRCFGDSANKTMLQLLSESSEEQDDNPRLRVNKGLKIAGDRRAILLLDLRLFGNERSTLEMGLLRKLLSLAEGILPDMSLPWPGFAAEELKAMKTEFSGGSSTGRDLLLGLLPRLLSLVEPTLPIILFSSTGRRGILQPLNQYKNVVSYFEKPRFTGELTNDALVRCRGKLRQAASKALTTASGRNALSNLRKRSKEAPSKIEGLGVNTLLDSYIDESRSHDGHFAVGSLLLTYPSADGRLALERALIEKELTWGESQLLPENSIQEDAIYIPKKPQKYDHWLKWIEEIFVDLKIGVAACGLVTSKASTSQYHRFLTALPEANLDLQFRSIVMDLLEAQLFDVILSIVPKFSEVNVDVATRTPNVVPRRSETLDQARARMQTNYGVSFRGSKHFYSLSSDGVHPLLYQVLSRRPKMAAKIPIERARGVTLLDYDKLSELRSHGPRTVKAKQSEKPLPLQIHYLADWISRFATWEWSQIPAIAQKWFRRGFLDDHEISVRYLLPAARAGHDADCGRAVLHAEQEHRARGADREWPASLSRWVSVQYGSWIDRLSGEDFAQFCVQRQP